ncbi:acyl carrier protein [Streptomyces sp. NPDC002536]
MTSETFEASARETVTAIMTAKFEVPPEALEHDVSLSSLDMDSLAVVELLYSVGQELGVRIGEDEVTQWSTFSELLATVEAKLAQRSAGPGR